LHLSLFVALTVTLFHCTVFSPLLTPYADSHVKPPSAQKSETGLESAVMNLTKEVRQLRLELLENQLDMQDDRIARLEQEVRQVQREQLTLRDQERAIISGLGAVGGEEESSPEEKGMMSRMLETTRAQLASLAQQEANLKSRLSRAQQRYSEIERKIKELKPESASKDTPSKK
jgi:chromosome segregation ATPase